MNLDKLAHNVSGIVRHDARFVGLMKPILNFAITYGNQYNETFSEVGMVGITKVVKRTGFLTKRSAWPFSRDIRVSYLTVKHEGVLAGV